jgi:hypothetical protein
VLNRWRWSPILYCGVTVTGEALIIVLSSWPWTGAAPAARPRWRRDCMASWRDRPSCNTDDIAWWHSRFGWDDLLIGGILAPARAGQPMSYRPPQWEERQRPGAIEVPADCSLLIIEGVGAARRESAHLTEAAIWVQSDEQETEQRNLARVGQPGGPATVQHLRDWMAEEIPFLAGQRPWEHADLIACGTPRITNDPGTDLVVAPPLARSRDLGK